MNCEIKVILFFGGRMRLLLEVSNWPQHIDSGILVRQRAGGCRTSYQL